MEPAAQWPAEMRDRGQEPAPALAAWTRSQQPSRDGTYARRTSPLYITQTDARGLLGVLLGLYTEAGAFMPAKSPMEITILLLISEPLVRVVIQEFLEKTGYVVMSTGDLGTAVDRMG